LVSCLFSDVKIFYEKYFLTSLARCENHLTHGKADNSQFQNSNLKHRAPRSSALPPCAPGLGVSLFYGGHVMPCDYRDPPTGKCSYYQEGGTCALPHEMVCTLWREKNAHLTPSLPRAEWNDLQIHSFQNLREEIAFQDSDGLEFFLVPEATGRDRPELTVGDMNKLIQANALFDYPKFKIKKAVN
jgi:hypothetical protein